MQAEADVPGTSNLTIADVTSARPRALLPDKDRPHYGQPQHYE